MSNLTINQLESLLLNEERQETYDKMVPKSQNLEYLRLMEELKTSTDWSSLSKKMKDFENNKKFGHQLKTKMKILRIFKDHQNASDEKQKEECLKKIREEFYHFDYSFPKPEAVRNISNDHSEVSDLENSSDLKLPDIESSKQNVDIFEKDQNCQNFMRLNATNYLNQLDFNIFKHPSEMDPKLLRSILSSLNNLDWRVISLQNFRSFFQKMMTVNSKELNELPGSLMNLANKLPVEWIEEYLKDERWNKNEQLVELVMKKKFSKNNNRGAENQTLEELEDLKEFIMSLKSEKFKAEVFNLNLHILHKQSLNNEYNKELFVEYVENIPGAEVSSSRHLYNQNFITRKEKNIQRNNRIHFDRALHNKLVYNIFLPHFFETAENTTEWEQYFNVEKLRKLFVETKLLKGEKPEGFENVFGESHLKNLSERVEFQIKDSNKKTFNQNEKVEIELLLKNVEEVRVKVFQINQQQTLLDNAETDFANLDLVGLMAKEDYEYKYNNNPLKQWTQKYEFDSITNSKRGVFIIDFISSGKTARAIIKKGYLNLVSEKHKLGTSCLILDEDLNTCVGKQTGLYINKKFYPTDENGIIYLPNNDSSLKGKVIVCHENFASIANVDVESPNIQFNLDVVFNKEQLRVGNDVDIVILPKLKINNKVASLSQIKNANLKIEFISETGSPKLFEFNEENNNMLELKQGSFTNVKVTFPPKTVHMKVDFNGKIDLHGEAKENIADSKNFDFLASDQRQITQMYLTKEDKRGYVVKVLGMNGEPLKNKDVNLNIKCKKPDVLNMRGSATSNSKGDVVLGSLPDFIDFNIENSENYQSRKELKENTDHYYDSQVILVEGEGLDLPIDQNNAKYVRLVRTQVKPDMSFSNDHYRASVCNDLSNDSKTLSFSSENKMVNVRNLKEGKYLINLGVRNTEIVSIIVLKGERFVKHSRNFIKTENELTQVQNDLQFWRLFNEDSKIQILQGKIVSEFSDQLQNLGSVEALLMCHTYIDESASRITSSNYLNKTEGLLQSYEIKKPENHYLKNKNMSEEILYVMRRRNQEEFIGNTLEKPTMLLKREKNQITSNDNENLKKQRNFDERIKEKQLYGRAFDRHENMMYRNEIPLNNIIDLSTGFLKNPGTVVTEGFSLNNENVLEVESDVVNKYNHVYVLFNLNGQIILTQTLKNSYQEPEKISLNLKNPKKEGNVYRKSRICESVQSQQKCVLDNIDKTTFRVIKSMTDLFSLIPALGDSHLEKELSEWKFLTNWKNLTPKDKLMKYDKFISHELNLFCFFKDKEFFNDVVKPHIVNKVEKDIVDLFLLNDKEQMRKYLNVILFGQNILTNLEQVLVLMTFWDDELGKKLAEGFKLKLTSPTYKIGEEVQKNLFDKVIESKDDDEDENINMNIERQREQMQMNLEVERCIEEDMEIDMDMCVGLNAMMTNFSQAAPVELMNRAPKKRMKKMAMSRPMAMKAMAAPTMLRGAINTIEPPKLYVQEARYNNLRGGYLDNHISNEQQFKKAALDVYEKLESTTEYVEKKYHFSNNHIQNNIFYSNLIENISDNEYLNKNFLDKNFIHCFQSPTEIILVMSLLDIGFDTQKPSQSLENFSLTITPSNNCIVFSKQVVEVKGERLDLDFLISQRFYDPQDRFIYQEDGTKTEKPVREFRKGKIYGSRVVVINSSVSEQKVQVITEVPQGSIPIERSDSLVSLPINVGSFRSEIIDFLFYFPENGNYKIFPATVAKGDKILAVADLKDLEFKVGETVKLENFETLNDILSSNNLETILEYLKTKNLEDNTDFDFYKIGWLVNKNKEVYNQVVEIYENRGIYNYELWTFAFKYNDHERALQLILNELTRIPFTYFDVAGIKKNEWQVKDYFPLVNPRAHSISKRKSNILNREFKSTYKSLLEHLLEKSFFTNLGGDDYILLISYLLLQDRVNEAYKLLDLKTDLISKTSNVIQRDYIEAYIDFMIGYPDFTRSKEICQKYLAYPVMTWRNRFVEIANQLAEYENVDFESGEKQEEKNVKQTKFDQAERSPDLKAEIDEKSSQIKCTFKNISQIDVEYYMIDLEILFSQDPFEKSLNNSLTKVLPFFVDNLNVENSMNFITKNIEIPTNLKTQNLLIRVVDHTGDGSTLKYIPFKLRANVNERYGILKLFNEEINKPVPKVYVKCFCKKSDGSVTFYKDGYTDLRGSFDFASVNSNNASTAKEFKLLVASKEFGYKILTSKPPTSSQRKEGEAKKIQSQNWRMTSKMNAQKNTYCQAAAML